MKKKILIHKIILTILSIIRERQLSHDSLNWRNKWNKTYDFIVVGAGAAGSVVAARLAEDVHKNILLLEAGKPQKIVTDIPPFQSRSFGTESDWNYPTLPQRFTSHAFIGNHQNISRGKAFGGCTMHNGMDYYRENPEYFQLWTDITGVKNWTYSHVLPYFRKSENNLDLSLVANDPSVHSTGGPLTVTTEVSNQIIREYINAAKMKGYPITYPDGRQPFGSTIMQRTIKDGVRQSTSLVFLERKQRKNLHILGQTLVTRILFNKKKYAIGVQFFRDNKFHTVFSRMEVTVSAGAIGSPHLLLLSGIGPAVDLKQMDIPVISNLKVGHNLLVQFGYRIDFDIKDQLMVERPDETLRNLYDYFVRHSGPLTYKAAAITCFHQAHYPNRPYLSNGCLLLSTGFVGNNLEANVKNYKLKEEWRDYYRPYLNRSYMFMEPLLKKPQSFGTIRLSSKNPFRYPVIDPCLLCAERDLTDLVKTFKLSLNIFLSPYMRQFVEPYKKPIPGCNPCPNDFFCDSYILCVIQKLTGQLFPFGGCRIGIANDRKAVVDQYLRVFGVTGLRVIDSSIIPVTSEQGMAITIMIGEYGADLIKKEYRIK